MAGKGLPERLREVDWRSVERDLDLQGYALLPKLLTPPECRAVVNLWDEEGRFRSRIDMGPRRFGEGEYRYFSRPLPALVAALRTHLYARLAPIANRWCAALGKTTRYPRALGSYTKICHENGQLRPTPLMLRYAKGDYNRLHQDLYGDIHFPLQLTVLLSRPGRDHRGGEFVLTEQRPRMQSKVEVVPLRQGEAVVFAVHQRPVESKRGFSRATMRHGVSEIRAGHRHALGVIARRTANDSVGHRLVRQCGQLVVCAPQLE